MNNHVLHIAACEDRAEDAALLESHIKSSGFDVRCSFFESGDDFLAAFRPGMYALIGLEQTTPLGVVLISYNGRFHFIGGSMTDTIGIPVGTDTNFIPILVVNVKTLP